MNQAPQADATMGLEASTKAPRLCDCGCQAPLKPRQERWASARCAGKWWDSQYPRINRSEHGPRQGTLKALILGFMADGEWHTEQQIGDGIHAFAHSVGARLSELRRAGHPIEVDRRRIRRYRLVGSQGRLGPTQQESEPA